MKEFFETWISNNMVDVLFWLACLVFAIRYGVVDWKSERARGFQFVLFMCFYGGFLVYRLGAMKIIQHELIRRCIESGIDITDIIPM